MWANDQETIGMLSIENKEECFVLEDQYQLDKVAGETRIPKNTYKIKLRTTGKMHDSYSEKYKWHKGMLELQNVPNFKYVYIHIGNTQNDTSGCLLVGRKATIRDGKVTIENSTEAYTEFYKKVMPYIDNLYLQIT